MSLRSRSVRWAIESAILIAIGIGLAAIDVGLTFFVIVMAIGWLGVAGLERAVLQPEREGPPAEEELPVHEAGVERGAVSAPLDEAELEAQPEWREGVRVVPTEDHQPVLEAQTPEVEVPYEPPVPEPEPEPVAVVQEEPPPVREPETEPQPDQVTGELPPIAAAEPEPERPPVLVEVPPLPPERPEPAPIAIPTTVVELPSRGPREWNLWDLERRARERTGEDPFRDEEWAALFVYLREYASPDGMLPPEFDDLLRESFGDLLLAGYA